MFKVVFNKVAQKQVQQAAIWYNLQQEGLELRFLNEEGSVIEILAFNPFFAIRYENVRSVSVKKFPYLMFYRVNETNTTVRVIAFLHAHSDSNKFPKY
jgi:hypothetical protein